MQQGQLTCHFYYCLWLRPPKGTFAKTPRRSGIGTFGTALWLWGGALTGRSAVIELVPPAVSASQREERRPKLHWEERQLGGGGGSQPLRWDYSNDSEVSGGFLIPPHSSCSSEAHLRGSALGHLSRGNSAQPAEPLNSAGPLPATFKPSPTPTPRRLQ